MHGALGSFGLPLWAVALVFAAFAPFGARALARMFEKRVHERSVRILAPLGRKAQKAQEAQQKGRPLGPR